MTKIEKRCKQFSRQILAEKGIGTLPPYSISSQKFADKSFTVQMNRELGHLAYKPLSAEHNDMSKRVCTAWPQSKSEVIGTKKNDVLFQPENDSCLELQDVEMSKEDIYEESKVVQNRGNAIQKVTS